MVTPSHPDTLQDHVSGGERYEDVPGARVCVRDPVYGTRTPTVDLDFYNTFILTRVPHVRETMCYKSVVSH